LWRQAAIRRLFARFLALKLRRLAATIAIEYRSPFRPSMDTAVTTTAPTAITPLVPATPGLAQRWQTLPGRTQLAAVAGLVGLLVVLALMFGSAREADYRVLFPNLTDKDGGAVIERLTQMNVPYRFAEGGSTIMVPAGRVHELRMKLASAGLPSASGTGGAAGYELLDKNNFGQTQGQERMKMQRAIEGELTTTIQALESVKSARVHLALPQQNGFFREQQKPSASVVLTLHAGRTLDRGQVAGIVKLVSGSVPELTAKAVSVVDSTGSLLSGAGDDESAQGLDSQQLQYRRDIEAGHIKRVMALLEPVMGPDNVRATVTAEIDFSQVMQTAEAYRPNQGADARATVREQRSDESNQPGGAAASGVPGATTNQPQTPPTAPINGPAQALQTAQAGAAAGTARREAATRFEVDKTVTVTKSAMGSVRRLSAAVVVNHRVGTDRKGKPTSTPLSEQEIEQLTALVQQGIGFNAERGDVVRVVNAPKGVPLLARSASTADFQRAKASAPAPVLASAADSRTGVVTGGLIADSPSRADTAPFWPPAKMKRARGSPGPSQETNQHRRARTCVTRYAGPSIQSSTAAGLDRDQELCTLRVNRDLIRVARLVELGQQVIGRGHELRRHGLAVILGRADRLAGARTEGVELVVALGALLLVDVARGLPAALIVGNEIVARLGGLGARGAAIADGPQVDAERRFAAAGHQHRGRHRDEGRRSQKPAGCTHRFEDGGILEHRYPLGRRPVSGSA
jgi:flagellar M-ring protein FliF